MTINEYIKADRQWPRHCRLQYAQVQLRAAKTPKDKEFWKAVITANAVTTAEMS
jgi:hypothetical protein